MLYFLKSRHLRSLRGVMLSAFSGGVDGVRVLAHTSRLPSLQTLGLSCSNIGDEGIKELAGSQSLTSLKTLDLQENQITDVGLFEFANSDKLPALKTLNLEECRVSQRGYLALACSLTLSRSITSFYQCELNRKSAEEHAKKHGVEVRPGMSIPEIVSAIRARRGAEHAKLMKTQS